VKRNKTTLAIVLSRRIASSLKAFPKNKSSKYVEHVESNGGLGQLRDDTTRSHGKHKIERWSTKPRIYRLGARFVVLVTADMNHCNAISGQSFPDSAVNHYLPG
jgi:hypothetical protein